MDQKLTRSDFHYEIPEELVAQSPASARDLSRLLVYEDGQIISSLSSKIDEHVEDGAVFIRNNSRVIPSRLIGQTEYGGKVELFLIEPMENCEGVRWKALGRPLKKLRPGSLLEFSGKFIEIISKSSNEDTPFVEVSIDGDWKSFYSWIQEAGQIPLPPYIRRKNTELEDEDRQRYQTVYSKPLGSVAAPTAGLHFTPESIDRLEREKNVEFIDITLHVGAGTFLPVKTNEIQKHKMHEERFFVPQASLDRILAAKAANRKIYAVGTTSLRCLESFYLKGKDYESWSEISDRWHKTDLFIYPKTKADRYRPAFLDGIMTNFHQSESTLMMLIASLIGYEELMRVYKYAIKDGFRFYSYGDSSLLKLHH